MNRKISNLILLVSIVLFIIFSCTFSGDTGGSSGDSPGSNNISVSIESDYSVPIPSGSSLYLESVVQNANIGDVTFTWYVNNVEKGTNSKFFDFNEITNTVMTPAEREFTVVVVASNGSKSNSASMNIIVDTPLRLNDVLSDSSFTNNALKDFVTNMLGYGMVYVHDLTELDLSGESFTDLSNIDKFSSLRRIYFGNRQLQSAQLAPLLDCISLVDLEWSLVSNFDVSCLSVFDKGSLRKLTLSYCDLEYEDVAMIVSFTNLTHLDLSSNGELKDIPNNTTVSGLISDLSELEELNLYDSDISVILPLSTCSKLSSLDIQNTYVPESDKNSLEISLPDCIIDWSLKIF